MDYQQLKFTITLPEIGTVRAAEVTTNHNGRTRLFVVPGLTIIPQGNTWFGSRATLTCEGVDVDMWIDGNAYRRSEDGSVDFSRYYISLSYEPVMAADKPVAGS